VSQLVSDEPINNGADQPKRHGVGQSGTHWDSVELTTDQKVGGSSPSERTTKPQVSDGIPWGPADSTEPEVRKPNGKHNKAARLRLDLLP